MEKKTSSQTLWAPCNSKPPKENLLSNTMGTMQFRATTDELKSPRVMLAKTDMNIQQT
jgi:hypothetical protein